MADAKSVGIRTTAFKGHHLSGNPVYIHFTDEHMLATEVCLAGWIVGRDKGDLLVGTVVSHRDGDVIAHYTSHDHVYVKDLPGRKIVSVSAIDKWHHV